MFKNVAVIGCEGFIGKALVKALERNSSLNLTLFGRHQTSKDSPGTPYFKFEPTNADQLKKQFQNTELIYYLISETIPATSWQNPIIEIEKNLVPFIRFLESVSSLSLKKIVFISSAGTIYGPSTVPVKEEGDKQPFSPYGITKLSMEHYLNYFEKRWGVKHDIYRVSNVYGPGQNTSKGLGIINTFLEKILSEGRISIFGEGNNIRNYIFINDVAELLLLSLRKEEPSQIYNLASDDTLSINDLVEILKKVVSEQFAVQYTETRQSDNSAIVPDNSKIKAAHPSYKMTTIENGIRDTYLFIKEKLSVNK